MKTIHCSLLVCLLFGTASSAFSQGTAFSYQGRLTENGVPANGNYDVSFAVFDAGVGGTQQGATIPLANVAVADGQLAVVLDFGPDVFTGGSRWLEIGVRKQGAADPPVLLSPRQALLPTPFAIHAGTAGTVVDGMITESKLAANAIGPDSLQDKAVSRAKIADGSVVKSLNNLRDDVTLAAGANVTITPNGSTLTIASTGGGGGDGGGGLWALSGTSAIFSQGHVGIGTASPKHRLGITGGPGWTGHNWGGAIELDNASAIAWNGNAVGNRFGIGQTTGGLYFFTTGDDPGTATIPPNYRMVIDNSGHVGIGTPWGQTPSTKLSVYDPAGGYGIEHSDGTVRVGTFLNNDGGWFGTTSKHKLHLFVNAGLSDLFENNSVRKAGVEPPVIFKPPPIVAPPGAEPPVIIQPPIDPPDVIMPPGGGVEPPAVLKRTPSVTIDTSGNVGIGNANPTAKLDVAGDVRATRLLLRADPLAPANMAVLCESSTVANFVPFNTANSRPLNIIVRDASVRQLSITGGADLAEPFAMSQEGVSPGSVVVIDEEVPGSLKLSTDAYDRRVAGVISGANGINPGIRLHQEGAIEGGENVALSGRVYVQADAAFGAIKPGDLLTTSNTPGHAMKVGDHAQAQGAILGKAMSRLDAGRGLVLVLVTLQ